VRFAPITLCVASQRVFTVVAVLVVVVVVVVYFVMTESRKFGYTLVCQFNDNLSPEEGNTASFLIYFRQWTIPNVMVV